MVVWRLAGFGMFLWYFQGGGSAAAPARDALAHPRRSEPPRCWPSACLGCLLHCGHSHQQTGVERGSAYIEII